MSDNSYRKGLLITATGVMCLTPDGLLVRLIEAGDWTILFWRGLLSAITVLVFLVILHRREFPSLIRATGMPGVCFAVLFSAGTLLFIFSLNLTTVANTLFIVSTSPLIAAIIALVFLKESVLPRTWIAIAIALFGIGIIASGSTDQSEASFSGDVLAFGTAVIMAATLSISRRYKDRSMEPAFALAGFFTAGIALFFTDPFDLSRSDAIFLGIMGCVVIPLGFCLLFRGPRYVPAPQVSLLLLLEAVLGPLWVWFGIGEVPNTYTFVGGAIVVMTLVVSNLHGMRR